MREESPSSLQAQRGTGASVVCLVPRRLLRCRGAACCAHIVSVSRPLAPVILSASDQDA